MPKTGMFDDTITFSSMLSLREKILTMQYFHGEKDFSAAARNLLEKGIQAELDKMDDATRRRWEQIRENVRAQMIIKVQKRKERAGILP